MWSGAAGDFNSGDANTEGNEPEIDNVQEHVEGMVNNERNFNETSRDLKSIHKSYHLFENRSLIGYMETDGVFLVTAGRDPDIKVWDVETEECVQVLSGHIGSITGLKLQTVSSEKVTVKMRLVISSSEDGTVRQWSIPKGEEIRVLTTANVITSMGLLGRSLVITGNHKGYLEVYHLLTGQLYAKELAHKDSIDALLVDDMYICTVQYGRPCSLKVWMMRWGKIVQVYNLEDKLRIEFRAFAMQGEAVVLGDASSQMLHFLRFLDGEDHSRMLHEGPGQVMEVKVTEGLIAAVTVDEYGAVYLYVHEQRDFDHLLTFHCRKMEWVSTIAALRTENTLRFVLGGSALAVLKLDFTVAQSTEVLTNEDPEKILNTETKEDADNLMNKLTKENTLEEDKVTAQAISTFSKMNIEPLGENSRTNIDPDESVSISQEDNWIRELLPSSLIECAQGKKLYYDKIASVGEKSAKDGITSIAETLKEDGDFSNMEKTILPDIFKQKNDEPGWRRKSQNRLPPLCVMHTKEKRESPKTTLEDVKIRNDSKKTCLKSRQKPPRHVPALCLKEDDNAGGEGNFLVKGDGCASSGVTKSGCVAEQRNPSVLSQKKEIHSDFVSDQVEEKSGCFRKIARAKNYKTKQSENSTAGHKIKKTCDIM